MNSSNNHPCPCCGYRTYRQPAGGTMQICPVCFWEDAPGERFWNGSNGVPLFLAQRNFSETGASSDEFVDAVRSPLACEKRPPGWRSYKDIAIAIIALIEAAFAGASLGKRFPTHPRKTIDHYSSTGKSEDIQHLYNEARWQEISEDKINKHGNSLTFPDPEPFRFYLPAFMRHALRVWDTTGNFLNADSIIDALAGGPRFDSSIHHAAFVLELDDSQNQAVAAFLKFVSLVDPIMADDARRGLEKGWETWLPDSLHFSYYTTSHS